MVKENNFSRKIGSSLYKIAPKFENIQGGEFGGKAILIYEKTEASGTKFIISKFIM
jgi:hypothetical protein